MELKDEIRISAPKRVVYDALQDPEILKQCIPRLRGTGQEIR